jgi:Domain of unknown function (DUF1996)/F5/8 type C domain
MRSRPPLRNRSLRHAAGAMAAATAVVVLAGVGLVASWHVSASDGAPRLADSLVAQNTGIKGVAGMSAPDVPISKYMPAYASSNQDAQVYPPQDATDDDPGTRWSSAAGGTQWLEVDLLSVGTINKVVLDWNPAYASAFKIQTSDNAKAWTTIYSNSRGRGGTETLMVSGRGRYVRMYATAAATQYGYSLWGFDIYGQAGPMPMMKPAPPSFSPNLDPGESIDVSPAVKGTAENTSFSYPSYVTHYEFQTDCTVFKDAKDDAIVYPRKEGQAAHTHAFMGSKSVNSDSTFDSLSAAATSCMIPQDHSGYWFPALESGKNNKIINPVGPQTIYYKSGIYDYKAVQPFPKGLRFEVANPMATRAQFEQSRGTVEGWECGNSFYNFNFPASCPAGSELDIRYQAPSCWDGVHLDATNHESNMAYPIHNAEGRAVCPPGYPVAVPMLEFKMAFPVSGDLAAMDLHLASGAASTWHYDFFDAWNPTVLSALVKHCINQGLQCDTHGYDEYLPQFGAVLGPNYQLLG